MGASSQSPPSRRCCRAGTTSCPRSMVVCWKLAGVRNRRQVLWAILGFFFPILALIILLVIGKAGPKTA